jgi:hypothetical protein
MQTLRIVLLTLASALKDQRAVTRISLSFIPEPSGAFRMILEHFIYFCRYSMERRCRVVDLTDLWCWGLCRRGGP